MYELPKPPHCEMFALVSGNFSVNSKFAGHGGAYVMRTAHSVYLIEK